VELPPNPDTQPCALGPASDFNLGGESAKIFFRPTFGNALVAWHRNVFNNDRDFTGNRVSSWKKKKKRGASLPIISRLLPKSRNQPSQTTTRVGFGLLSQAGRINASTSLVNYHYGPFTVGGRYLLRVLVIHWERA